MSEEGLTEEIATLGQPGPAAAITAGMMMRNAREAAGLHVAALAVSMKIPVKKLEALEADRLDLLHDAVFVRALAASVCRALKMDPAPVLDKLPLNTTPRLNSDERGINAPFRASGGATGISVRDVLIKPSAIVVFILVLAGIAIFFVPDIKVPDWATGSPMSEVKPADRLDPMPTTSPAIDSQSVAVSPAVVPSEPPTLVASTPVLSSVGSSAPAAAASDLNRGQVAPVLPTTGIAVFKAKGSSWVKVVDANGVVQLSKTLAEGEVVGVSGTTPLSVVIGRADATEVEVRGKPFALSTVAKENVARFEVK